MKKIILAAAAASVILTGCSGGTNTPATTASPSPIASPTVSPSASPTSAPEVREITETGVYGGRADSNYIEVILSDGSYESLKLSDELKKNLETSGIEEDDNIEFTYTETNGEKVVNKIIKKGE